MKPILNIAAYLFVSLDKLEDLRALMLEECHQRHLKGTILLTGEGINMFLAGAEQEMRGFLSWLRSDPRFSCLLYTSPSPRDRQKSRMPSSA